MKALPILSKGEMFNRLTVIELDHIKNKTAKEKHYICLCKCSNKISVTASNLRTGQSKSCGCLRQENILAANTTHGLTKHPLFKTWHTMISRCHNINDKQYIDYGAREIKVSENWRNSLVHFIVDMGEKPSQKHTLDRIDNNSDYCLENCRWATKTEQANNRRSNVFITINNKKLSYTQWEKELNLPRGTIYRRIKILKWNPEKAVLTPAKRLK